MSDSRARDIECELGEWLASDEGGVDELGECDTDTDDEPDGDKLSEWMS